MSSPPRSTNKKLTYRYGGMAILVGLGFLAFGLVMTGGLLYVAFAGGDDFSFWPRVLAAICAAIPFAFAVLGLLLTLSGHVVIVDPFKSIVRIKYGQWLAWKRERVSFKDFDHVELFLQVSERRATDDGGSHPTYMIRLLGPQQEIDVCDRFGYRAARAVAEQIAGTIGIDLHDATSNEPSVRSPNELDQSLKQRSQRLGESTTWPTQAGGERFEVIEQPNATLIRIPRPSKSMIREGITGLLFLLVLYGASLGGTAYYLRNWLDSLTDKAGAAWWHPIIYAAPVVAVLYVILPGIVFLLSREEVAISATSLKHTRSFAVGQWSRTIANDKIVEVVVEGDDVVVRSDEKSFKLGVALEKKERQWLKQSVKFLIVNGPR